jgi:N-acetylmuramoyl-L-alanine amidase
MPGACTEFAPAGRWNGATVFLDPGHGGIDPGAISRAAGTAVYEKQVTLAVGLRALGLLRGLGYRVVMSRTADETVARHGPRGLVAGVLSPDAAQREIVARDVCADEAGAQALIGLHMDSFGDPTVAGAETFYARGRPFSTRSRLLADYVQQALLARLRRAGLAALDRGVLPDFEGGGAPLTAQTADYHHLIELGPADRPWLDHPSSMPGILTEPLFLTNPREEAFALSARGQLAIAGALAGALDRWFGTKGGG